jgi:glycosyltransferase involved in cell wall biosynthesis
MMKPVISVLLPVFNGEAYLKPAIESVLKQTSGDWELFVGDNASTDGTRAIIESYRDPRIRIHQHATNIGLAPNWDFLMQNARGDYACVLGSDDIFAPEHLERKVELLKKRPDAPYVHGAVRFIDSKGNDLPPDDYKCAPIEERNVTLPRFLKMNFVNVTSMVIRVAALHRYNLGFELRYPLFLDWSLNLKLAMLDGPLIYDSQPTASYRVHPQSLTRLVINSFHWPYEAARMRVDALTEYPSVWKEIGIDPHAEACSLTKPFWRLAVQQVRLGNFSNARQAWRFFREFHSTASAFLDFPQYVGDGFKKIVCGKPS